MKHQAKKRFGQNFLTDQTVIRHLMSAIHAQSQDVMVEIGPGLGAITQPLIQQLDHLHVIEIDRDIIQHLQHHYPAEKITIHHTDVLQFDFTTIGQRFRVVGNLPYNISSPILFKLLAYKNHIVDMHFMLQKEVVQRMVAQPSNAEYGRLSAMLQYHLHMEYVLTVPAQAFEPAPKIESAFVRCIPHANLPFYAHNEQIYAQIVQAAFGQRRKTLRNTLKGWLSDADFDKLQINSQLRAENLSVQMFVHIANYLSR